MKSGAKRQVAILAGGLGTRLRPITEKIPKPLVPICDRPFLYWQLMDLQRQGYVDVLLCVSYLGEMIEAEFGDGSSLGLRIRYAYEREPLGTGGALKNALPFLDESFFILNGDSFLRAPLDRMSAAFDESRVAAMISTYDMNVPVPVPGNIKADAGKVIEYRKGAGRDQGFYLVDSGIYILSKSLFAERSETRFQLEELWPGLIASGKLGAFAVPERFYDIGTPERLKEFEEKIDDYFTNAL